MLHTCSLNCVLHVVLDFCQSIYNRKLYVFTPSLYEHWVAFHYFEDQSYVQGENINEQLIYLKSLYRLKKQNTYFFQVRWILRFHNSVFSLDSRCSQVYTSTNLTYDKFASIDSIFLFFVLLFLLYATFLPLSQSFNRKNKYMIKNLSFKVNVKGLERWLSC